MIIVSLFVAAYKITSVQPLFQVDRQVVLIWVLLAVCVVTDMVCRCYYNRSQKNENTIPWVYYTLNAVTSLFLDITIWEFSFQLLNVSVEIEESLSRRKNTLTKGTRQNTNLGVCALILVSYIVGLSC